MTDRDPVGFVGLGNMGSPLASNLVGAGRAVLAHDVAGPERAPEGVAFAASVAEVARRAEVVVLSLPDGRVSQQVAGEVAEAADRKATHVVDTSTIGVAAAEAVAGRLADAGIGYVDAAVSGGPAGARARTLAIMVAGSDADVARVEPVLAGLSDRRFRVGDRAGLGQALKLLNNFLSATALAATSEALAFGRSVGLDLATMLEVLAASSGTNTAVTDKFPKEVLSGRYAYGFKNSLMLKDVQLYLGAVQQGGGPSAIGRVVTDAWERFEKDEPGADFTRIYAHIGAQGS